VCASPDDLVTPVEHGCRYVLSRTRFRECWLACLNRSTSPRLPAWTDTQLARRGIAEEALLSVRLWPTPTWPVRVCRAAVLAGLCPPARRAQPQRRQPCSGSGVAGDDDHRLRAQSEAGDAQRKSILGRARPMNSAAIGQIALGAASAALPRYTSPPTLNRTGR
jgi:hypothetical protein